MENILRDFPTSVQLITFAAMKKTILYPALLVLVFFGCPPAMAQTKCPANFDGKSFDLIRNEIQKHQGETVAFDAVVSEVKKGYNDIPYFSVRLENGSELWIASMVSDKYVAKDAKLRLLGYIDLVQADDEIASKYNQDGFHIRVFAMLDHKTKQMQMANVFEAEVKLWLAGKIPSDLGK